MRGHRAPAREVAAGLADAGPPGAGEERGDEEHRAAEPGDERGVGVGGPELPAAHPQRRRADAVDLRPEALEEAAHRLDVADARGVLEDALLGREQAGGEDRQRRVLVALDLDDAGEAVAALDDQARPSGGTPRAARSPPPGRRRSARRRRPASGRRASPRRARWRPPSLTTKFACTVETRAAPHAAPFRPARSTSAPAEQGTPSGRRTVAGSGFWKTQPALGRASGCVRLRKASDARATARSASGSPGAHAEGRRAARPRRCAAGGCGRSRTPSRRRRARGRRRRARPPPPRRRSRRSSRPWKCALPWTAPPDRAGRARPLGEAGEAVADRVAHEAVHRDAGLGADAVGGDASRPGRRASARRGRGPRRRRPGRSTRRRAR